MKSTIMTSQTVVDSRLRDEEVIERFPEVEFIDDEEIREATIDAVGRGFPDYFWDVPASSSGKYHNVFARSKHGLHIHVKMVCTVVEEIIRSHVKQGLLTEREADCARSAAILHDMLKFGHDYEEGDHSVKNHDLLAGMWLSANTDLPQPVLDAVERHNGPWMEGPTPEEDDNVSRLVHDADMIASRSNITVGVHEPCDTIATRYPTIPRADL